MASLYSVTKRELMAQVNLEVKAHLYQRRHEDDKKNKHVVRALAYVKYCERSRGFRDDALDGLVHARIMGIHVYFFGDEPVYYGGVHVGELMYHVTGKTARETYLRSLRFARMLAADKRTFDEHAPVFTMRMTSPKSFQVSEMRRVA